jgi:serine/threonine-protein kinase HipA
MAEALRILLRDREVGILEYFDEQADYVFTFSEEYLAAADRPVLGQVFEDRRPTPILTSGMPCWFAHLLPQGLLRKVLLRSLSLADHAHFDLLRALGSDLPGAVVVEPTDPLIGPSPDAPPILAPPQAALPPGLKFSLAGIQLKISVRQLEDRLTVPVSGEQGRELAKFASSSYPALARVEHATLHWAGAAGITVVDSALHTIAEFHGLPAGLPINADDVLVLNRFDRRGDSLADRVHMEDFGQILDRPPGDAGQYEGSYEEITAVLRHIAPDDLREFVRRLVFVVLSGNGDAHLKNWSVLYPDTRNAVLSPAYDLVPSVMYLQGESLALSLDGSRDFQAVGADSFRPLAAAADVDWPQVRAWVAESVEAVMANWSAPAVQEYLSAEETAVIQRHLESLPLVTNHA